MKQVCVLICVLCCAPLLCGAAVPSSQPATEQSRAQSPTSATKAPPATTQATDILAEFKKATDPSNDLWTSALPRGTATLLGYKTVPVKQRFVHDTNFYDRSLPDGAVPGSAGTTILNRAQYIDFGYRVEQPLDNIWSINVDATGLFAATSGSGTNASGFNLVDQRSANDNRPVGRATSVYTDSDFGFEVAVGVTANLSKNIYVGGVFDLAGVFIDNGWDRYSNFEIQKTNLLLVPSGGFKFGFRTTKKTAIECDILAGKNGFGLNAGLVSWF